MKLKIFSTRSQPFDTDLVFLLTRCIVGIAFILHGMGKIQNAFSWMGPQSTLPGFIQALGAVAEFGGGIALVLGLVTRLASLGILCTMLGAIYLHAIVMKDPFVSVGAGSYELATVYLLISLLFLIQGPGRFSLDRVLFGNK
jgi:putative oxidoreductase